MSTEAVIADLIRNPCIAGYTPQYHAQPNHLLRHSCLMAGASLPFPLSLSKGFDKLSPNGVVSSMTKTSIGTHHAA